MTEPALHAVILAGGSGTRFWPASRRARPKQFLSVAGDEPLIVATRRRLEGWVPDARVLVVTAQSQAQGVRELLPDLPPENVLAESAARNTAAAVAWAALCVQRRDPNAVMAVLPADHVVQPAERFKRSIVAGARLAAREPVLLTYGIRPTHAATGYGYIEVGEQLAAEDGEAVYAVARFVEKPDAARAAEFLASGRFLWNAGIFVWSVSAILDAFERFAPDVLRPLCESSSREDLDRRYASLPALPVDVAILERASNVRTIPIDYRWSDVGSWSSIPEVHTPDAEGNACVGGGALIAEEAHDCIVYAEDGHLTALVGVKDLIVVHANGATLVLPRERAQDVRRIVERLGEKDSRWL